MQGMQVQARPHDTERVKERVAEAVAALIRHGLIPQRRLVEAAKVVGITSNAIVVAARRQSQHGYRPTTAPSAPPPAPLTPSQQARDRRPDHFPDGTTARRCTTCRTTLDIEHFRYVAKGVSRKDGPQTFGFRSRCNACWKAYQRERYLTVTQAAVLAAGRIELVGDQVICSVCREPLTGEHSYEVPFHPWCETAGQEAESLPTSESTRFSPV